MTHSLHRLGTIEDLKRDYVILAMLSRGINDQSKEARERIINIGSIFEKHDPSSIMMEKLWPISPVITASFDNKESVMGVLRDLKREDYGISIVVSGLVSEVRRILDDLDMKPHTAHLSLGIFGNKELLPSEEILEITTMCGHHCISPELVKEYINKIKKGKISVKEAAQELSKPCVCGIFNPTKAFNVLNKLIKDI
jgi:hypothetical protein